MRQYEKQDTAHSHEWSEPEVLIDEDVTFRQACEWTEILGSTTCDRLDETFYHEGQSCDESRYTTMSPDKVYVDRGGETVEMDWNDVPIEWIETFYLHFLDEYAYEKVVEKVVENHPSRGFYEPPETLTMEVMDGIEVFWTQD